MRILGIETSTQMGSVALIDGTNLLAEYRLALPLRHGEKLLPLIDTLLKDTRMALSDLSAIAVSIGPGSYTGLRVGLATARGLAIGSGLPLLPVPTLEAMATPFRSLSMLIVPMTVSRKEELFWGLFSADNAGLARLHPDSVASLDTALDKINQAWVLGLQPSLSHGILFLGDGALLYRDRILRYFQRCGQEVASQPHAPSGGETSVRLMGGSFAKDVASPPSGVVPLSPLFVSHGNQSPLASSVAELGLLQLMRGNVPLQETEAPLYLSSFQPIPPRVANGLATLWPVALHESLPEREGVSSVETSADVLLQRTSAGGSYPTTLQQGGGSCLE